MRMNSMRDTKLMVLGNIFMQEKYMVFDYTPIFDMGEDYMLIGMADKDPDYV